MSVRVLGGILLKGAYWFFVGFVCGGDAEALVQDQIGRSEKLGKANKKIGPQAGNLAVFCTFVREQVSASNRAGTCLFVTRA